MPDKRTTQETLLTSAPIRTACFVRVRRREVWGTPGPVGCRKRELLSTALTEKHYSSLGVLVTDRRPKLGSTSPKPADTVSLPPGPGRRHNSPILPNGPADVESGGQPGSELILCC